jgi:dienelactone hydrolase
MNRRAFVLTPAAALFGAAPDRIRSAGEARRTFTRLLKIPLQPPAVKAEVRSPVTEDGLIVEDISWPAADEQTVPAFLIRPSATSGPLPAIVCLHGTGGSRESETTAHFGIGDWTRPGQSRPEKRMLGWARELARRGYATLSLTQRGLDRRTPDTNDQAKDLLVRGRTLMGALVEEIRQAVTYLGSRPEIDRRAIGMTGMSFGGITTFYTWLADDRIAAAAPLCGGVGSVDVLLRKGRPSYHGFYWWIPEMLTAGDQGVFAAAMAPRPLMLWAPTEDIGMPKEGVDRFAATARPAYERAGASGKLVIHQPPGEHSFTHEAFDAMTAFFDRELKQPKPSGRGARSAVRFVSCWRRLPRPAMGFSGTHLL